MSFVVSVNGQFKPYDLPDLSHYNKVRNIFESTHTKRISEGEVKPHDFRQEHKSSKSGHTNRSIQQYQKVKAESERAKIPHYARDIMSSPVHEMTENETYEDLLKIKNKFNHRHFPIINEEGFLVGIISDRDLIRIQGNPYLKDIMSQEVLTTFERTRIQDIANIMLYEKLSALPVINNQNILTGIVTQSDILRFVTQIISIDNLW